MRDVVGTWVSEVRQTKLGTMTFLFRIESVGRLEITGSPNGTDSREGYLRRGVYRLEGDTLLTPILNDGRPVRIERQYDQLVLTIDEKLEFRLRRG